eukprot:TRINITY_DN1710_c0_g1_i18.p1 TRINITY_DN1710_c0_g1~~TRINITY_DN1710_c0_g1_i18.p1  ORF type:complete len:110 (+),score=8.78 TRINITY_DN1710_c0_g1_i18:254-583(+)
MLRHVIDVDWIEYVEMWHSEMFPVMIRNRLVLLTCDESFTTLIFEGACLSSMCCLTMCCLRLAALSSVALLRHVRDFDWVMHCEIWHSEMFPVMISVAMLRHAVDAEID